MIDPEKRRAYLVFGVVGLALLMSSLDITIVAVALPTIRKELDTSLAWAGWTLTASMLTQGIVMPLVGRLSETLGRKRLFLGAVALFTASSIAAGLAPNIYLLIICRVLQSVGGGAFLPSATGIVSDVFKGHRRTTAIGLFTSILPLGGAMGPNVGGFIVDHLSWRWIFFVNGPIGILLLILGAILLPSGAATKTSRPLDVKGAIAFASAMIAVLFAMTRLADHPGEANGLTVWLLFAGGIGLLGYFLRHEGRIPDPMIDPHLLKHRPFLAANFYNFVHGWTTFGFFSFIPYYLDAAYNISAGGSGVVLTPRSLVMAAMSTISSFALVRMGYRLPMVVGVLLISLSIFLVSMGFHDRSILGAGIPDTVLLIFIVSISGVGIGLNAPAANNAILDIMPEKTTAIAGIRGMFRTVGGVMGTATITLALSRYDDQAAGLEKIFFVMSIALLLVIPVVFLIPDTIRGRSTSILHRDMPSKSSQEQRGIIRPQAKGDRS